RVGLKKINELARAPGPRAQCAPVVGFARLAFVDEADDALAEGHAAVVGLDAAGVDAAVAPALRDSLSRPSAAPAAPDNDHRHLAGGVGGGRDRGGDFDVDGRVV